MSVSIKAQYFSRVRIYFFQLDFFFASKSTFYVHEKLNEACLRAEMFRFLALPVQADSTIYRVISVLLCMEQVQCVTVQMHTSRWPSQHSRPHRLPVGPLVPVNETDQDMYKNKVTE